MKIERFKWKLQVFNFLWNGKPWKIRTCLLPWPPLAGGKQLLPSATLWTICSPLRQFPPGLFQEGTFSQTPEVSHRCLPFLCSGTAINACRTDTTLGGSWMTKWELGTSPLPPAAHHFSLCRRTDFSGQYYPFRESMPSVYFYFGSLWGWHCQKGPRLGIKTQRERHRAGG